MIDFLNLIVMTFIFLVEILNILFGLIKSKRHNITFNDIVSCTSSAIEIGCSFSSLSTSIAPHLQQLTVLLEKRTQDREKLELLILAYHCCRNIAADFRFEVCRFTESAAKHIHKVFNIDLNEDAKESLFKLMDLSIIAHYPNLADGRGLLEYVHDASVWNKGLRNYSHIVGIEMKQQSKSKYRSFNNDDVNQVFVQFAARLSYLVRWDNSIWLEIESEEETSSKRVRRTDKLQSLMELAQPTENPAEFNWKWLAVIAEVIYNYPSALENEDFRPLLQMLSKCQTSGELEYQIYAFAKCCFVLLERDESFIKNTNSIIANLCSELWHNIADVALRVCATTNKTLIKNHALLQILIHHHKYPSNSFIEDVIKIFLSKSTIKVEATLQTLVSLLTSFNLDLLHNGKELTTKLLAYVFEKTSLADFKQIIATSGFEKPSARILAQIGAICCLSKTDVVNFSKNRKLDGKELFEKNFQRELQKSYLKEVGEMTQLILLKCYDRLLIQDDDFNQILNKTSSDIKKIEFPLEIKCIIDSAMYDDVILKVTEFKTKVIDDSSNVEGIKDYLKLVLENNELMMSLADSFISFEAFNEEKFTGSFAAKKIDFHMQEMETLFGLILQKRIVMDELDMRDTHQLLLLVKSMFSASFHQKISRRIRSFPLTNCLRWVSRQVTHKFLTQDDDAEPMHIGWDEFANAKIDERMKFLAIETLCEYNNFEGIDTDWMADRLEIIQLDYEDNMDLHTIFHVLKVFGHQKTVPKDAAVWIWSHVMKVCSKYHSHQYLSSRMIEVFGDIVNLSKNNPDMTTNVIALLSSFGKLCASPTYSPTVTIQFIHHFQFFHLVNYGYYLRIHGLSSINFK